MTTDPTSQLVLRQLAVFPDPLLVVNPQDDLPRSLSQQGMQVHWWALHAGHGACNTGVPGITSAQCPKLSTPSGVLFILPKEKALTELLLAQLAGQLPAGTTVWVVGRNTTGIKSFPRRQRPAWSGWDKVASGNHCQLFQGQLLQPTPFEWADWYQHYPLQTPQGPVTITGLPGVFSPDRLDAGTELLLTHAPPLTGAVLDFGCGTGVISAVLSRQYPHCQWTLSDVNPLALLAAERSMAAAGQFNSCLSDGLQQLSGPFDWVVTNPPFHTGKDTDYEITRQFIATLPRVLQPNGQLLLVANRFLPYAAPLQQHFRQSRIVQENNKFRLYHAVGPRKS